MTELEVGLSAVAAMDKNGSKKALMVTNKDEKGKFMFKTEAEDTFIVCRINEDKDLDPSEECNKNQYIEIDKYETVLLISK